MFHNEIYQSRTKIPHPLTLFSLFWKAYFARKSCPSVLQKHTHTNRRQSDNKRTTEDCCSQENPDLLLLSQSISFNFLQGICSFLFVFFFISSTPSHYAFEIVLTYFCYCWCWLTSSRNKQIMHSVGTEKMSFGHLANGDGSIPLLDRSRTGTRKLLKEWNV